MLGYILNRFLPNKKSQERTDFLNKIFNFAKTCEVEGDYLEFGVFKGATFTESYKIAHEKKMRGSLKDMRFFAFDSFEGLPEPKGVDKEFRQFEKGEYSFSLERFTQNLSRSNIKPEDVTIVPGWFKDTLTQDLKKKHNLKKAAVVWIDGDLYESTVPCLDFVYDLLVDGTIIVFDDWFFFKGNPQKGEQRAFGEWLARHPELKVSEFHKYFWHGNSFIIHKR